MASAAARRPRPARELVRRPGRAGESGSKLRVPVLVLAVSWPLIVACRGENAGSSVDLVIPTGVGRRVEFVPKSAFAEYVELPELRRELRITLANYALSCDRYVPPGPKDVLFVLTLDAPPGEPFHPGTFPLQTADAPDAGPTARPKAFAVARDAERGFEFPSGGSVELRTVELSPSGLVSGVLGLEFPGDGTRPPAGAHGKFDARLCRSE